MAADSFGHHYPDTEGAPLALLACDRCGIPQQDALRAGPCSPMTAEEQYTYALAGMRAAIEYARVQHSGMSGAADLPTVQTALDFIRGDCQTGNLDLPGALAAITLRAAELACRASAAAGHPLTIGEFLDDLAGELTVPDDISGLDG